MNKLFTKIAALALGATMAVGVGVAVASNAKEPTKVSADSTISGYDPVSSIAENDVVYFTYVAGGNVQILTSVTSGTKGDVTAISGTTMNTTYPLTVGKSGNYYTFKDKDNKYLAFTSTSTSSNNKLWLVDSASANGATWTVSFSGTTATIVNVYNSGRTLRGNTTSGQYRICGYTGSTGNLLTLYKQSSASSYGITTSVDHGTYSGDTTISEGGTASVTITPSTGYKLPSTVSVSGATQSYDSSTGVVSLSNPTGAVTVSATCVAAASYTITVTATNCTYSGASSIYEGSTATITFTANSGYELPSSVTPTGASVKSWTQSTGVLELQNPTGNVSVSVTAIVPDYDNTPNLTPGKYYISYDGHYFTGSISSGKGASSTTVPSTTDAAKFTFSLVGDDTWTIKNDENKYLAIGTTSTSLSLTTTLTNLTVESGSATDTYKIRVSGGRYMAYYSSGTDFRTYNAGQSGAYYDFTLVSIGSNHTVSFNANGGTGTMENVLTTGTYTLPANGFTAPTDTAFAGWKANNTGSLIAAGGSYSVNADVEFYAQWAAQRTLTYNANGGSGTMTDSNSPYGDGATVTVLANTFTAPTTDERFSHWNTASDDTGLSYDAGDTFTIGANTVLYAIWEDKPSEINITYESYSANLPNSGYADVTWTADGISGTINSIKQSSGSAIQMKNNQSFVYNSIAISGYITSITITKYSGSDRELTAWVGSSPITSNPETGGSAKSSDWVWTFDSEDHYTHFRIYNSGAGAFYASSIVIGYEKVSSVDPTSITLDDATAISMDTYGYGRRTLNATVGPFNAYPKTVTWGSNNTSVVTIADGVLTPVGTGTTTVYACTSNYDPLDPNPDLIKTVSVTVYQAEYRKATFSPTSTSAVSQSDDYLQGGSVTLSTTGQYNSDKSLPAIQLAASKEATFTISGYDNMQIVGIDLVMSSNANEGTGSLTVTAGSTDILEIETAPFSDPSWNGAFDANPVHLYKDCTDYVVQENETIVFSFATTVKSLYIHSVSVRYLDYSLESWCEDFLTELTGGEDPICKGYGITDTTKLEEAWTDLGARYLLEVSDDVKYIIEGATADESGTAIERAAALYDWCVTHYSASICDRFIDRASNGSGLVTNNNTILPAVNSETSIAIIVVISIVSVSAIGGYFFLRKRKETN